MNLAGFSVFFQYSSMDNHYGITSIPTIYLSLYRNSFGFRGANNWNSLPRSLRQMEQIGSFKRELEAKIKMSKSNSKSTLKRRTHIVFFSL
jgi:hypothetical protein